MWAVIKFDRKYFNLLKYDLEKRFGKDFEIYRPKIAIQKYYKNKLVDKEIDILGDYLFLYHKNLNKYSFINELKYIKGLKYLLDGYIGFQDEIIEFIKKCRNCENKKGLISEGMFEINIFSNYKFSSGPFVGKIFKIINIQKDKMNILMGNLKTKVRKKEFLFYPA